MSWRQQQDRHGSPVRPSSHDGDRQLFQCDHDQPGYAKTGAGSIGKPGAYQKTASENASSGRILYCPPCHLGSADRRKSPFVGGRNSHKTEACIFCFPISGAAVGTLPDSSVFPLRSPAPVHVQEDGKTAGSGAAEGDGIR